MSNTSIFNNIFSTKVIYISTISVVLINILFFPDLLNNKDIKLLDNSYIFQNKVLNSTSSIEFPDNKTKLEPMGIIGLGFLSIVISLSVFFIVYIFKYSDKFEWNEYSLCENNDLPENISYISRKSVGFESSIDYSLIDTTAGLN